MFNKKTSRKQLERLVDLNSQEIEEVSFTLYELMAFLGVEYTNGEVKKIKRQVKKSSKKQVSKPQKKKTPAKKTDTIGGNFIKAKIPSNKRKK